VLGVPRILWSCPRLLHPRSGPVTHSPVCRCDVLPVSRHNGFCACGGAELRFLALLVNPVGPCGTVEHGRIVQTADEKVGPPYFLFGFYEGLPLPNCAGEVWGRLQRWFAPSAEEVRATLIRLRKELAWSRAALAAFLGVGKNTLKAWETGERKPNRAAWRLGVADCHCSSASERRSSGYRTVWAWSGSPRGRRRKVRSICLRAAAGSPPAWLSHWQRY